MLTLFTIAIMILFTKCLLWGTIRAAARDWVLGQITNIHTIQIQATRPPPSRRRRHVMERGVLKLDLILSHNQHHHQCTTDCMLKGAYHQSILKSQVNVARRCPLWSGPGSGCRLLLLPASVPGPAELLLPQPGHRPHPGAGQPPARSCRWQTPPDKLLKRKISQYFSGDFLHPSSPADLRLGGDLERDISKTSASVGHRPGGIHISDNYISILCNRFSTGIASKLVLINNFVYTFHADSRNSQVIFLLICIVLKNLYNFRIRF